MAKVELNIIVNRNKKDVFGLIKHFELFPNFVKNIKSIKILENLPGRLITEWEADIDDAQVTWQEEDIFDDSTTSICFNMLRGDFKAYKGKWLIGDYKKTMSKIYLSADFDWGIPVFERFVGDILLRKARVYLKGMLRAIKNKAESKNE